KQPYLTPPHSVNKIQPGQKIGNITVHFIQEVTYNNKKIQKTTDKKLNFTNHQSHFYFL
ncbi:MAG: hypothetical protein PWQ68_1906, partial [Thermoanaerobacteraceae bacterium]|nr:hypothetical protein [Thermoanaerobacteraceae bacterium]